MASESMVEGEVESEQPRKRQKFSKCKVYIRKLFRRPRENPESDTVMESGSTSSSIPDALHPERNASLGVVKDMANHSKVDAGGIATLPPPAENLVETNGEGGSMAAADTVAEALDKVDESQTCNLEALVDRSGPQTLPSVAAEPKEHSSEEIIPEPVATAEELPSDMIAGKSLDPLNPRDMELPSCATTCADRIDVPESISAITLQPPAPITGAPSNDSTSLNRQAEMASEPIVVERNGDLDDRDNANMALVKKRIERRSMLESELAVVRSLVTRIEAKQGEIGYGGSRGVRMLTNDNIDAISRFNSEVTTPLSIPTPRQSRPLNHLSISVMENGLGIGEGLEKEKRTPKANQFYRNSEFLLAKDKIPPAESNKKSKSNGRKHGRDAVLGFGSNSKMFKSCSSLLERLMKHKHGWVFNNPVDVEGLRLHDYYTIIKCPMDLGTIKSRLGKNWYKAPEEFAEDVRLTFNNAMTYNPKGQDVHVMAEQLLNIFEEKWEFIKSEFDRDMRFSTMYQMGFTTPQPRKAPPLPVNSLDSTRMLSRSESLPYPSSGVRPKPVVAPARTPAPKKPKAKDPNKRDMTYEEKQKLSTNLQSLPSEKLDNIVQIIKKRNSTLSQHDDEIEIDIDIVDAETLWELDRFVTNYKKSLSKNKRKAELAMQARMASEQKTQEKITNSAVETPDEQNTNAVERIAPSSSPLHEKDSRTSSSSSSSSDSGSSSSDSDSDSSSASGSDVGH